MKSIHQAKVFTSKRADKIKLKFHFYIWKFYFKFYELLIILSMKMFQILPPIRDDTLALMTWHSQLDIHNH